MEWLKNVLKPKPPPPIASEPISPFAPGTLEYYGDLYERAEITDNSTRMAPLMAACDRIEENKERYQTIEKVTNVPWDLVASLHCRESSLNFTRYLGNGDPLAQVTTHVPVGRGPFPSWELGAADALHLRNLTGLVDWTLPLILKRAEAWNGLGYQKYHPDVPTPYLWSFTSIYSKGKYAADGKFDPNLEDAQPGIAAILKELRGRV